MADKKKLKVWLPLLLSLSMIAGMFIGYRIRGNMPWKNSFFIEKSRPVQEVLDLIGKKYVDTVNSDSLGDIGIQAILGGLDPHSVFIPAGNMKQVNEDLEGVFNGIGIEFSIINDTTNILRVLEGGPGQISGLKPGDKIIKVDGALIAGNHTDNDRLQRLIRGERGSKVRLSVLRNGQFLEKEIIRGPVRLFSVDASYMLSDTIGYIRISRFSETTYKEFMTAMDSLHKSGMKALVLDLRDNGGGILTEATNIADEFLNGDKLITYTVGAHSPKKEYRCNKEGVFESGKLVVLINEGTASASEVLAGALQDWGRATIIGRRSFGKGLVQEQYELSDGSGLRLTVARYFTPLGRSIQRSYKNGNEAYYHDIIDRYQSGEMRHGDSASHPGEKKFVTATGKVLFGGDGISPDIFVPIDTTAFEKTVMKSLLRGTFNQFVYLNFIRNQNTFSGFANPGIFLKDYSVSPEELENFKSFAKRDTIPVDLQNPNEKYQIALQIKMLTARLIWGTEGFFEVKNTTDSTVRKALQEIKR